MHITLKFLGDLSDHDVAQACQTVNRVCSEYTSFQMHCVGAGAFPNTRRPRTLWLGCGDGGEALAELHKDLDKSLNQSGFARERRGYHPHLTLGRIKHADSTLTLLGELVEQHADFDAGETIVDEVVVYQSQLERSGPVYTPMSHVELRDPD